MGISARALAHLVSVGHRHRLGLRVSSHEPKPPLGQVVGNIVSEWTQILGLVLLTKRLLETGSKETKS